MQCVKARKANGSRKMAKMPNAVHFNVKIFLSSVGIGRSLVICQAKKVVFRQGGPADAVFYIQSGKIQISAVSAHGREAVIATLGAGDFFGEGCLTGQPLHVGSATALTESTVVRIEKQAMIRGLRDESALSGTFLTFLLARNIQFEADLVDQLFNSNERRLARVLLSLADFGKEGKWKTVAPRISQNALAVKVGTTRSRINFYMSKFGKLGFIAYSGGLQVNSGLLDIIVQD
jgi:CRP/FNR family cyclic AMP-dependent transcriptional regulator